VRHSARRDAQARSFGKIELALKVEG